MSWEIIKNEDDVCRLEEIFKKWNHARVRESYCHPSSVREQPSGASGSGRASLDVRILFYLSEDQYLEIVLDYCECVSIAFEEDINFQASVDSIGRIECSFNTASKMRAGRLRYRRIENVEPFYFRSLSLLPVDYGE